MIFVINNLYSCHLNPSFKNLCSQKFIYSITYLNNEFYINYLTLYITSHNSKL